MTLPAEQHPDTDLHRAGCAHCQYLHDAKLPDGAARPMRYIVPIGQDDVARFTSGYDDKQSVWCIVAVDMDGASIIDSNYPTLEEAREAWPEAIAPSPIPHLTSRQAEESAIAGKLASVKLPEGKVR